ncbi:RNA polymerase sigma factor, sigma-70 family [Desulfonispora thiosulfatigenes DSM 11270]|uniref:RNA polymerase sigma factor, sigma-70 family n=1 Tax=Desulfonispora thiosulfatigenes DSM 11270 TaxID=656914 RepID=A0A1W1V1E0_DESTI|nr:sigma-70 family RNA polymerase sigma factor [Desulfonispora thiosulfatigenes]SMB87165.1 RNA polymerase sigma factor, sigma-70 family [Desulfonispora thiosulfatigenes DSM 11270]
MTEIEAEFIQREENKEVYAALKKIPERDQRIIFLKYSGYSYREIAESLNLEEASIGTYLVRAKKKLKIALDEIKG